MTTALCIVAAFLWCLTLASRAWAQETAQRAVVTDDENARRHAVAQAGFASGIVTGAIILTIFAVWSFFDS